MQLIDLYLEDLKMQGTLFEFLEMEEHQNEPRCKKKVYSSLKELSHLLLGDCQSIFISAWFLCFIVATVDRVWFDAVIKSDI